MPSQNETQTMTPVQCAEYVLRLRSQVWTSTDWPLFCAALDVVGPEELDAALDEVCEESYSEGHRVATAEEEAKREEETEKAYQRGYSRGYDRGQEIVKQETPHAPHLP